MVESEQSDLTFVDNRHLGGEFISHQDLLTDAIAQKLTFGRQPFDRLFPQSLEGGYLGQKGRNLRLGDGLSHELELWRVTESGSSQRSGFVL